MRDYVRVHSSPATVRDYRGVIERYLEPGIWAYQATGTDQRQECNRCIMDGE